MVKNKIENSPNPFLRVIQWSGDMFQWVWEKASSTTGTLGTKFTIIDSVKNWYCKLNQDFLELLTISARQTIQQFGSGVNYILGPILIPPGLPPSSSISNKSIKTTNQELQQLNTEYGKKNSVHIPLFEMMQNNKAKKEIMLIKALQNIKLQEDINSISTMIKELNTQIGSEANLKSSQRIDLYDSDDDKEKIE
jgi:hypothetical protein